MTSQLPLGVTPPVLYRDRVKAVQKRSLKWVASVVVVLLLISFLTKRGTDFSWERVTDSFQAVGLWAFLWAGVWVLLQTGFQVLRLWCLLPRQEGLSLGLVAYAYSVGQWLNSFVPARAGDVVKAAVVSRAKQDFAQNAGVVISDKIVDLVSLATVVVLTGGSSHLAVALEKLPWSWLGVGLLAAAVTLLILRKSLYLRFPSLAKFEQGFRCLGKYQHSVPAWLASCGSWACEAVALIILVEAQGSELAFSQAVYCLLVLNVAIAVPVSVANVGTFEGSLVFALGQFGLGPPEALAIAALHHLLQWGGISVWALATWFQHPQGESASHNGQFRVTDADKERAIDYYGSLAHKYDYEVNRGILKKFRDCERRHMLQFADLNHPAQTMIDVGCGNGFYALAAKKNGLIVTAVDASADMVLRLVGRVDETITADIEELRLPKPFDRVVCAGVLDFVRNPESTFGHLARLVAPAGRLVLLSPRVGIGGLYYRLEKRVVGIRVNLYHIGWYRKVAIDNGLTLVDYSYPLFFNMAVLFEKPRSLFK